MQPGWNWNVKAPVAPQATPGGAVIPTLYQGPVVGAPPLRYAPGLPPQTGGSSGPPNSVNGNVANTGTGPPQPLDWWQASQVAASPVTTLGREATPSMPFTSVVNRWPGRAAMLGRQWHRGNTGNASAMSHGWPSNWYDLRLPVAYIPAARQIWRSIRTFTQATRSNDRQYIPAVFVPASPVNTLGVNHAP